MAEPKIYTKNYVTDESVIIVSSNSAESDNIRDFDKTSVWESSGQDDDTDEASIEVQFREANADISRDLTRVILLNHNFKDISVDYWTGSAWSSLTTASNQSTSNAILTFSSQATERIRVRCLETQTADQEKQLGQLIACDLQFDIGSGILEYYVNYRERAYEHELGDGSIVKTYIKHSPYRSGKYGARVMFRFITESQLESLRLIKEAGSAFLWHPESDDRIDEIYYVHWANPFTYQYTSKFKGAGFDLNMQLKEV